MDYNTILKKAYSKGLNRYEIANWLQEISKEPKSEFFKGLENADYFKLCEPIVKEAVLIAHTNYYQSTLTESQKQERQEKRYFEACSERLSNLIAVFEKRYKASEEKELLLNSEIALYSRLLKTKEPIGNDKFYLPNHNLNLLVNAYSQTTYFQLRALNQFELKGIREKFDSIIVNGFRDFKDNSELTLLAESFNAYLKHLESYKPKTPQRTFADYLNHKEPESLASAIRKEFKTEKGIDIRVLIEILKEKELLTIPNKGFRAFHEAMKNYFDRNIGTYTSVNDAFKSNGKDYYKGEFERIRLIINELINNL